MQRVVAFQISSNYRNRGELQIVILAETRYQAHRKELGAQAFGNTKAVPWLVLRAALKLGVGGNVRVERMSTYAKLICIRGIQGELQGNQCQIQQSYAEAHIGEGSIPLEATANARAARSGASSANHSLRARHLLSSQDRRRQRYVLDFWKWERSMVTSKIKVCCVSPEISAPTV